MTTTLEQDIATFEAEIAERQAKLDALKEKKTKQAAAGIPANMIALQACVDTESTRYAIGGLSVKIENGRYEIAATDSLRLAILSGAIDEAADPLNAVLWPRDIAAVIGANCGDVKSFRRVNDLLLRFKADGCTIEVDGNRDGPRLMCKPVDGQFPRYPEVVPTGEPSLTMFFNPKLLAEALELCSRFSQTDQVKIEFRQADGPIVLTVDPNQTELDQELKVVVMPKAYDIKS